MTSINNIRILWITILALIILNVVTLGALWITRPHLPYPRFRNFHRENGYYLNERLHFSTDQLQKFKAIKAQQRQEMDARQDSIRFYREQLMGLMQKQEFGDSAELLINKIGMEQSEIDRLNYKHFREILSLCDSSQKPVFIETMKRAFMPHFDPHSPHDNRKRGFGRK